MIAFDFPDDENGDVLRRMQDSGFDFSAPCAIEFFALFPTEEAADAVADQYAVDHESDPLDEVETSELDDGRTELVVVKTMLATHANITAFEKAFARRARAHGGHVDGWGVLQE